MVYLTCPENDLNTLGVKAAVAADLKDKLNDDLKQAMRGGDTLKRLVIRTVLSAVHNAEITKKSSLETFHERMK